jgi:hypothetical protein
MALKLSRKAKSGAIDIVEARASLKSVLKKITQLVTLKQ